jgi:hypothetical protein
VALIRHASSHRKIFLMPSGLSKRRDRLNKMYNIYL